MAFGNRMIPLSSKNTRRAKHAHEQASQQFRIYDTSAIVPKRRFPVIPVVVLAVFLIAAAIVAAIIIQGIRIGWFDESVEVLPDGEEAVVAVQDGEAASSVASKLVEQRLISRRSDILSLISEQNLESSIIPGTYLFEGGMSANEILQALLAGPETTGITVTIPEGYTRAAIAQTIGSSMSGLVTEQQFLDATDDASVWAAEFPFLAEVGTNALEGYLFPKTYTFTASDTAETITRAMLQQYQTEVAGLDWTYATNAELTQYDAVKLASIVEKEASPGNMATVASVFYNRLDSDYPYLESDATTAYEVGHDPTPEEVHAESPYSTYTNEGLPPTPICSPSLASLQAVCAPEDTTYLYFYTNDDGTQTFSETYEEHQQTYQ